ncbi:MAG TPA: hypothetical protein VGC57_15420 [Cellulomonas sp.]
MSTAGGLPARLDGIRRSTEAVQQRLDALALELATANSAGSPGAAPSAVTVTCDEDGLVATLVIDHARRRRTDAAALARQIEDAVLHAQPTAGAMTRLVPRASEAGDDARPIEQRVDLLVSVGRRTGELLDVLARTGSRPAPVVVRQGGATCAATSGVVRTVTCDPGWLVRSTDVVIAEAVVVAARRAARDSLPDLCGERA